MSLTTAHLELALAASIPPKNSPTNKGTAADPDAWREIFNQADIKQTSKTDNQISKTDELTTNYKA